jgi:tRNA(Ile)-lysidine synthase
MVRSVGDRVEIAFHRSIRELVPAGATVLVAVSGGSDSIALLHLLSRKAQPMRLRLVVAHLDHALRRGSATDRRFVEGVARELGLDFVADRRDVARARRRDESPEEAARRVRRAFLLEAAASVGATHVATGHTLDDQAETVLLRLARGAGARALTGMARSGPGPFVRPLLAIERAELRAWLSRRRIAYREDPSNTSLRFDRNRVRRLVVPVLSAAINPRSARLIVQAAERFREDAVHLDAAAERRLDEIARPEGEGLSLDARALASESPVLARRIALSALVRAGVDPRRVSSRHVEGLLRLGLTAHARELHLPGRRVAARRGDRIVIAMAGAGTLLYIEGGAVGPGFSGGGRT